MKKFILSIAVIAFVFACTVDEINTNENKTEFIDPEEECPEWDRCNCDGIPDDEQPECD